MKRRLLAWGWVLKVAFTGSLLWYIIATVPLSKVLPALQQARLPDVYAALTALLVARGLMGLRMKRVTDQQGMSLKVSQLIGISLASTFYGTFMPGSLSGGLVRWYRISRQDGKPTAALAAIGFDRLMDTMTGALFGLGCWLLSAQARQRWVIGSCLFGAAIGCLFLYYLAFHSHGFRRTSNALGRPIKAYIPVWLREKLQIIFDASKQYHNLPPVELASILCLSLLIHLVATAAFVFLGRSLGMHLAWIDFGWIRSAWLLLAMLPITIAGLGLREGSLLFFLKPYGIAGHQVIALSCLRLATSLVIAALGGVLELRFLRKQRSKRGA